MSFVVFIISILLMYLWPVVVGLVLRGVIKKFEVEVVKYFFLKSVFLGYAFFIAAVMIVNAFGNRWYQILIDLSEKSEDGSSLLVFFEFIYEQSSIILAFILIALQVFLSLRFLRISRRKSND